jgi:hypothetical protein
MARELAKKRCSVTVVDKHATTGESGSIEVIQQDLDEEPQFDPKEYDCILMLDMIEHLHDPEKFLERLRARFDYRAKRMIFTTPNVAFGVQRLMLLLGQFNYGKTGILDRTHTRLFTFREFERLLTDAGFRIKAVKGIPAPFPKALGSGPLGRAAVAINAGLIRVSRTLFSYQIYVEAESTPDVEFIVRDTRIRSEQRLARLSSPPTTSDKPGSVASSRN